MESNRSQATEEGRSLAFVQEVPGRVWARKTTLFIQTGGKVPERDKNEREEGINGRDGRDGRTECLQWFPPGHVA